MAAKQDPYLSYLLHLRLVERNGELVWWASLENPRTGERHAFADLTELFTFLDEKTVHGLPRTGESDLSPDGDPTIGLTSPVRNPGFGYLSYLLRLLGIDREGKPVWRISLQSPHTAEWLTFSDLEALMHYLKEKLSESYE